MNKQNNPLESLYPFLHNKKKDARQAHQALLDSISLKVQDSLKAKQHFFEQYHQTLIDAAQTLANCYQHQGQLFTMGNGGSSCDASHMAVEFQHPVTAGRPSLPATNINNDMAFISAVANDIGIQHVFARQIEAHAKPQDCIIAFSTSGHSENILNGLKKAKESGLSTIGFVGGDGGAMKSSSLLDHCLCVHSDSIHRVQEVHVTAYHILWDLTHTLLADHRGNLQTTRY